MVVTLPFRAKQCTQHASNILVVMDPQHLINLVTSLILPPKARSQIHSTLFPTAKWKQSGVKCAEEDDQENQG